MKDQTAPPVRVSSAEEKITLLLPKLQLIDKATFAYFGLVILIALVFHQRLERWYFYVLGHLTGAAVLLAYFKWVEKNRSRFFRFVREIYPLIMFSFTFKEVSLILNDVFPFWFEKYLLLSDKWLFGDYSTVIVQRYHTPWLTELMAFFYWSYYLIMPLGCLVFFVRQDWKMLRSCLFHISFTMYMCYLMYYSFGARGPRDTLEHLHLPREAAGFFDSMVLKIQATASISGSAFPSSHVAAVWIVLIFMFRFRPWAGWATLPLIVGLTLSTVYLQYHYTLDAVAGILFVFITYPLGRALERRFGN